MKIIITENQFVNLELRRNLNVLPKYIRATYNWLNPKAFENFDDFLDRVVFSTTRDYVGEYIGQNTQNYDGMRKIFLPLVRNVVMNEFHDEILDYYNSH